MWAVLGVVCLIDINPSAVDAAAADRLALRQTTGDTLFSFLFMRCTAAGDKQCMVG